MHKGIRKAPNLDNGGQGSDARILQIVVIRAQEAADAAGGKLDQLRAWVDGGDGAHAFIHNCCLGEVTVGTRSSSNSWKRSTNIMGKE